jgi:hypothetical protein
VIDLQSFLTQLGAAVRKSQSSIDQVNEEAEGLFWSSYAYPFTVCAESGRVEKDCASYGDVKFTGALKGAKLCLGSVLTPSFQGGDLEHKSAHLCASTCSLLPSVCEGTDPAHIVAIEEDGRA